MAWVGRWCRAVVAGHAKSVADALEDSWRILAAMRIPAREGAATTRALVQANTPPLLMNADPAEGLCVTRSRGPASGRVRTAEDRRWEHVRAGPDRREQQQP
jgi:hypothetical protein